MLLRDRAERARDRADARRRALRGMGRLLARGRRRLEPRHPAAARRLRCPSRAHVDRFWQAGTAAGYESDGEPGPRPQYSDDYYGAFLLDPDGNSIEAVHHGSLRDGGDIDHIWIRVSDVEAATHSTKGSGPRPASGSEPSSPGGRSSPASAARSRSSRRRSRRRTPPGIHGDGQRDGRPLPPRCDRRRPP